MSAKDRWARYNAKPETKQAKHEWYLRHKKSILEKQHQDYASKPEVRERKRRASSERYAKSTDKVRAYRASPSARRLKAASDARNYSKNGAQVRKRNMNNKFMRNYGLTQEQIDQLIADRNGLCDICHKPAKTGKKLNVDHDHKTGKFRGMLCWSCNVGLGHLGDTPERLCAAAEYLERSS